MSQAGPDDLAEHHRALERMYLAAPINRFYRPDIAITAGTAEIRMAVRPEWFHAAEAVHGSVYFKALDDAAFFAANSMEPERMLVTAGFQLNLLRPVTEGTMVATGTLVHPGRLAVAEAELRDGAGRLVAKGSGTFARSERRLEELADYDRVR